MISLNPLYIFAAGLATLLPVAFAVSGNTQCSAEFCITGINHNNATTSYDLTVTAPQVGWVSMGFGRSMINTPLVILWKDSNGNTVVSQRKATDYVMPTVDPNPPVVAQANNYRAVFNSSATTLSFSVPTTTDLLGTETLVFAWSRTQPSSNAVDATLVQHDVDGRLTLNMANALPNSIDGPSATVTLQPTATSVLGEGAASNSTSLTSTQRAFAAHGILLSLAFLVILPFGALQARYLRTYIPGKWWFAAHWILQWPFSMLLIIIGYAFTQFTDIGDDHSNEGHKRWGFILICLYIFQCSLGGFIHFVKSATATKRPPQNYAHAVLGLVIIALSFWQAYTGLDVQWPRIGGVVPRSVWTWWTVWAVMMPILYAGGLVFLPRQYKMEAQQRKEQAVPLKVTNSNLQERQYSYDA